jgi:transcriptional regulator with XRE-family HTH domain
MSIGTQTKAARIHLSMSQKNLADEAECSREAISRIENGRMTPSVDLLCRLTDALGVSLDYLTERGMWHPERDDEIDISVLRAREAETPIAE